MNSTLRMSLLGYGFAGALVIFGGDGPLGLLGLALAAVLTLILLVGFIARMRT